MDPPGFKVVSFSPAHNRVPLNVYHALEDSTITTFIKFMAHRYRSAPVRTGKSAVKVPESEKCPKCAKAMTVPHKVGSDFEKYMRVLWECAGCASMEWRHYGQGFNGSGGGSGIDRRT